jgi:hypothetical protein
MHGEGCGRGRMTLYRSPARECEEEMPPSSEMRLDRHRRTAAENLRFQANGGIFVQ